MKKLAALYLLLSLSLSSCSWTIPYFALKHKKGDTYIVWDPDKVPIYKEPISKSEPFYLTSREAFIIEDLSCSDYRFSCNLDLLFIMSEDNDPGEGVMFYKIRFESGEYGYIKMKDFDRSDGDILDAESAVRVARREPALYKNADFDSIWNATLNTLEGLGYVIEAMSKEEGHITTKMRTQKNKDKDKVSIRLSQVNDSVKVAVTSFRLYFKEVNKETGFGYWYKKDTDGYLEQQIKEMIDSRLQVE